ncbi:MAG TPA: C39 family peptidase [Anaerolineaceae bacterium]|jgi:hypothetical protein
MNASPSDNTLQNIRLPFKIPYYAQTASPEWVEAVFEHGVDPAGDPRWEEWQPADRGEYADWCSRVCGVVCVKMCIEALGGVRLPVMEWVRRGLAVDGYSVQIAADGSRQEIGWVHSALVCLVEMAGLHAAALPATPDQVCGFLAAGHPVIASVSYELGTVQPVTRRGGHLVVITGADLQNGDPTAIILHNPSGRCPALRENARVTGQRFSQAFSNRVIVVSRQPIPTFDALSDPQEHPHAATR